MARLKDFSPDGRAHLTDEEVREIALRYSVGITCVEGIMRDVMRYDNDPSFANDKDLPSFICDFVRKGDHQRRVSVTFAMMARNHGFSVYDAVDFLVAYRSR